MFKPQTGAMQSIADQLDDRQYGGLVEAIRGLDGRLIFMGVGKTGHIGEKLAATFASLSTPSFFVHATEIMHGDLGMVTKGDLVILISNSGETKETLAPINAIKRIGAQTVAFTGRAVPVSPSSATNCCSFPFGAKPMTSGSRRPAAPQRPLMAGDAIDCTVSYEGQFTKTDFAGFHPGGTLGQKLLREGVL